MQNGIEIDLGFFKNVSVDEAASTMTVGGAVVNGDVIEPLYAAGKELRQSSKIVSNLIEIKLTFCIQRPDLQRVLAWSAAPLAVVLEDIMVSMA